MAVRTSEWGLRDRMLDPGIEAQAWRVAPPPGRSPATAPTDLAAGPSSHISNALGFQLRMLEQLVSKSFVAHFQALDITPTLFAILTLIHDNPLCRQTDLSNMLKMHQPNVANRIGVLIDRGLVAARPDPSDRRANALQLTFAGKHFMDKLAQAHNAHTAELRAALGTAGYDALMAAISELPPLWAARAVTRPAASRPGC